MRTTTQPTGPDASAAYEEVYAGLGYLFYAIAASSGRVSPKEQRELDRTIKRTWLPYEGSTDEWGVDAAQYIAFAFERAIDEGMHTRDAMRSFEATLSAHPELFTQDLKELVRSTARSIAAAQAGIGKKEWMGLVELERLLH